MSADTRVWDPDPLSEGDRVRVRFSGECQAPRELHAPALHGAHAEIEAVLPAGSDHRYLVRCPQAVSVRCADGVTRTFFLWYLARSEMERLA